MSIKTQCAEVVKAFLRISDWLGRLSTLCLSDDDDDIKFSDVRDGLKLNSADATSLIHIFIMFRSDSTSDQVCRQGGQAECRLKYVQKVLNTFHLMNHLI